MLQDEALRPQLDVEMKDSLNGEDLEGVGVSGVEDGVVAGDGFGGESPQALVGLSYNVSESSADIQQLH